MKGAMRGILIVLIVAALGVGYGVGRWTAPAAVELQKVIFALDWTVQGSHAPFFLALEKGYFEEEGISVDIYRGYGSGNTATRVDIGTADFGHSDTEAVVLAISQGANIKTIGMFYAENPLAVFSLAEQGIEEPKDMEGHDMAVSDPEEEDMLEMLCTLNNVDFDTIETLVVSPAAVLSLLWGGEVDMIQTYTVTAIPPARTQGIGLNTIRYSEWGMEFLSNGLITSEDMINEKPGLVRRFARAVFRGIKYSMENPAEAIDALLKHHPELGEETAGYSWELATEHMKSEEAIANGLGWVSEEKMTFTLSLIDNLVGLSTPVSTTDVYTNEFLPGIYPPT